MTTNDLTENTEPVNETTRFIVVGVDGSDHALRAAVWAAQEAQTRGVALVLAHAVHLPEPGTAYYEPTDFAQRCHEEGARVLGAVLERLRASHPNLEITTQISDHSAAHQLVSLSTEAELVVTGTRGRGGFAGLLAGSVSRALAAHARCPLVVVREPEVPEPDVLDEVVLGVGRKPAPEAIRHAFEAARRYGASLTAVHAWWPRGLYSAIAAPGGMYIEELTTLRDAASTALQEAIDPYRAEFPDVKVQLSAPEGNAVPMLADAARRTRLLVIGAHRSRGPLSVGAGYVADGLLGRSPVPIAIIPAAH